MTYRIEWDYDHHALHVTICGDVSQDGLKQLNHELLYYLDALQPFRANLLIDVSDLSLFQLERNSLRDSLTALQHDAVGWVIDVNCRLPRFQAALHTVCCADRVPYFSADCVASAHDFLEMYGSRRYQEAFYREDDR
jgi:hypothetical protein